MTAFQPRVLVVLLALSALAGRAAAQGTDPAAPPVGSLEEPAPAPAAPAGLQGPQFAGGVFAGVFHGTLEGTEVEKADVALGFEAGAFRHLWRAASVWVSAAMSSHDVSGQIMQLLDQDLDPTGRSVTAEGTVDVARGRAGLRLDSQHEPGWRFAPYMVAAVCFSRIEVTVDKVNGGDPLPSLSSFDDTQLGGMARFGVEYAVAPRVHVDVQASYEVFEFPAGTDASVHGGGGLVYRF